MALWQLTKRIVADQGAATSVSATVPREGAVKSLTIFAFTGVRVITGTLAVLVNGAVVASQGVVGAAFNGQLHAFAGVYPWVASSQQEVIGADPTDITLRVTQNGAAPVAVTFAVTGEVNAPGA